MEARREVAAVRKAKDPQRLARARDSVQAARVGLGERGPVWWEDGAKDYTRYLARNTPYREWFESCGGGGTKTQGGSAE